MKMPVPIEKINVTEYSHNNQSHMSIIVRKSILRLILEDYWQQRDKDFIVEYHQGKYFLWLIKTDIHRFWTQIPDDTCAFIVIIYYTLMYPHERLKIRKTEDNFILELKNIQDPEEL